VQGTSLNPEGLCRCRSAVLRAYQGMIAGGEPETVAREAAAIVFRWYQPTVEHSKGDRMVASWIEVGLLH
jgi:hypothetical protein